MSWDTATSIGMRCASTDNIRIMPNEAALAVTTANFFPCSAVARRRQCSTKSLELLNRGWRVEAAMVREHVAGAVAAHFPQHGVGRGVHLVQAERPGQHEPDDVRISVEGHGDRHGEISLMLSRLRANREGPKPGGAPPPPLQAGGVTRNHGARQGRWFGTAPAA